MRLRGTYLIVMLAILISACKCATMLSSFWDDEDVTVTEDNYYSKQDRFAQFAELLEDAPVTEATDALEPLFNKLLGN